MTRETLATTIGEVKFSNDQAGRFTGYGAVFGNIDARGDRIERGAFTKTLRDWEGRGKLPPMLLQHGGGFGGGPDDMLPVGRWTSAEEDAKGLKVEGQLFGLETERGTYIHEGMKSGVLDGLSIGYRAVEFQMRRKPTDPRRTLKAVELFEISIVTFPMNDKARLTGVKAADSIRTERDFEAFLRDEGGFSHSRAKAIASHGFKAAIPRDEDEVDATAAMIRRNIETLTPKRF